MLQIVEGFYFNKENITQHSFFLRSKQTKHYSGNRDNITAILFLCLHHCSVGQDDGSQMGSGQPEIRQERFKEMFLNVWGGGFQRTSLYILEAGYCRTKTKDQDLICYQLFNFHWIFLRVGEVRLADPFSLFITPEGIGGNQLKQATLREAVTQGENFYLHFAIDLLKSMDISRSDLDISIFFGLYIDSFPIKPSIINNSPRTQQYSNCSLHQSNG